MLGAVHGDFNDSNDSNDSQDSSSRSPSLSTSQVQESALRNLPSLSEEDSDSDDGMTIVSTISGDYTGADDTLASLPHCATCMDVIVGATTTECGHDVCYTGIKELEQRHEKPSFPMSLLDHTLFHCPECRGPVESTSRSFEFDAMIEQLVVKYAAPGVLGSYFERKEQYQRFIDNEREEKKVRRQRASWCLFYNVLYNANPPLLVASPLDPSSPTIIAACRGHDRGHEDGDCPNCRRSMRKVLRREDVDRVAQEASPTELMFRVVTNEQISFVFNWQESPLIFPSLHLSP